MLKLIRTILKNRLRILRLNKMKKIKAKIYAELLNQISQEKDKSKIDQQIKNFVILLAKNNQISRLDQIIKKFNQLYNKANLTAEIEIEAPTAIDASIEKVIIELSKKLCQTETGEVKFTENKDLIGGAKIKINDYLLDLSIKNTLTKIKNSINNY